MSNFLFCLVFFLFCFFLLLFFVLVVGGRGEFCQMGERKQFYQFCILGLGSSSFNLLLKQINVNLLYDRSFLCHCFPVT